MEFLHIQQDHRALSISDDDLCSECKELYYCPGDLSICAFVADWDRPWPCVFDMDGYSIACKHFKKLQKENSPIDLPYDWEPGDFAGLGFSLSVKE